MAATSVTTTPTAMPTATVVVDTTRPVAGRSKPSALNKAFKSAPTPTPPSTPSALATMPTIAASATTDTSTCRRAAPIERSSAISRARWATMIDNVL